MGCPIRKSTDRSLFAAPRGLSQRTTSFIASCHQGIHQMPLSRLIALIINAHPSAEDAKQKPQWASFVLLPIQLTLTGGALTKRPDHSEKNPASVRLHPMANRLLLAQNQANPLFTIFQIERKPSSHNRRPYLRNLFLPLRMHGGACRDRTGDLKLAKLPLSQLS